MTNTFTINDTNIGHTLENITLLYLNKSCEKDFSTFNLNTILIGRLRLNIFVQGLTKEVGTSGGAEHLQLSGGSMLEKI